MLILLILIEKVSDFVKVLKDSETPDGIKYYEYCISNNTNFNNCKFIKTETSDGILNYQAELIVTENQNIDYINIIILDDNDNEIDVLIGYIGHEVLTDEPIRIDASTDIDVSNYTKIIYEKVDINEEESINN